MKRQSKALIVISLFIIPGFVILYFITNHFQVLKNIGTYPPLIRANKGMVEKVEKTLTVNQRPLTLEIVSTTAALRQGLSDRVSMERDHGMLFLMGESRRHTFWMYHMHFPLDIIWISGGVIVDIATLSSPKPLEFPATHTPDEPADTVLELNAGQAQVYGLHVGEEANFTAYSSPFEGEVR